MAKGKKEDVMKDMRNSNDYDFVEESKEHEFTDRRYYDFDEVY